MGSIARASLTRFAAIPLSMALMLSVGAGLAVAEPIAPPTAFTGYLKSVLPTSAVVTGTVNPDGATTDWYFEYGLSSSTGYASKTLEKSAGSGTADVRVLGSLTGLAPTTSYSYRIVATNSRGTTVGGVGIFHTTATPTVLTGAANKITASSATLNGVINPEALSTSWYFEYGQTTSYRSKTVTKHIVANLGDTIVSATISHLLPRTTYHFRIIATSSAGKNFGTDLTLTTGLSVTLNTYLSSVIYGDFVALSGTVTSGRAGTRVAILSEAFNQTTFSDIATITTGAGGLWSYLAQPTVRTTFMASANGGTSSPVVIGVRPRVYLNSISRGRLTTRVIGGVSFASHVLQLQRLSHDLWVTWKHVRLDSSAKATFSTSLPKGETTIRMAIGPSVPGLDQSAPGYLAGFSRTIHYRR
ncbi:MAG TPA: hypothetical protein VMU99_09870 [Acidimicrobiales bacterium]|nr:hypothetical protein [Acidimicrobiales bacterium]